MADRLPAQTEPVDLPPAPVAAPVGKDLLGKRLKVTGGWVNGRLVVTRVEQRDPRKDPATGRITGQLDGVGPEPRTLHFGSVAVEWGDGTSFKGVKPDTLAAGASLEVKGRFHGGRFVADSVEAVGATDKVEMLGTVTAEEHPPDGTAELTILGAPVLVPRDVPTRGAELARRLDERRPEKQLTVSLFGRPLTIGGEVEVGVRLLGNRHLDGRHDDQVRFEPTVQPELLYFIAPRTLTFLQVSGNYEGIFPLGNASEREETWFGQRDQMWLYSGDVLVPGLGVQIGRQNIHEAREWWWDADLDAIRAYYDRPGVHLELGAAEEFWTSTTETNDVEPDQDGIFRVLGQAAWGWRPKQRVDAFFLRQEDHSRSLSIDRVVPEDAEDRVVAAEEHDDQVDGNLTWLGLRASGELDWGRLGESDYWLGGAWVGGEERTIEVNDVERQTRGCRRGAPADPDIDCIRVAGRRHHVDGVAFDSGTTWASELPGRPAFTLAYAFGSGDPGATPESDRSFRQTGLQGNNGRFRGVDRFRYYGELLRPELSNLHIFTAALGFRFLDESSIELLYHYYRQVEVAPFLRDSRIDADPTGERLEIGHEWDAVLGMREWEHVDFELIGALFLSGAAYGDLDGALATGLFTKLTYNF